MRALQERVSLKLAAAVFIWFTLLSTLLAVLRDSPLAGQVIAVLAVSWMVFGLSQFIVSVRFKWRLEERAPEVVAERRIGSLLWGVNAYRLSFATQDERVLGHPDLRPMAFTLAGLQLGAFSWGMALLVLMVVWIAASAVQSGDFAVLLALLFILLLGGLGIGVPAYLACKD